MRAPTPDPVRRWRTALADLRSNDRVLEIDTEPSTVGKVELGTLGQYR